MKKPLNSTMKTVERHLGNSRLTQVNTNNTNPKNYEDWEGSDVPGKANIGFDSRHYDKVVYGFRHHKEINREIRDAIDYNKETIEYLKERNKELKLKLK